MDRSRTTSSPFTGSAPLSTGAAPRHPRTVSAARFGGSAGGDRPLTIAGIGLELLGYAHVAEMLHRVAMAQRAADGSTPPFERGAA